MATRKAIRPMLEGGAVKAVLQVLELGVVMGADLATGHRIVYEMLDSIGSIGAKCRPPSVVDMQNKTLLAARGSLRIGTAIASSGAVRRGTARSRPSCYLIVSGSLRCPGAARRPCKHFRR